MLSGTNKLKGKVERDRENLTNDSSMFLDVRMLLYPRRNVFSLVEITALSSFTDWKYSPPNPAKKVSSISLSVSIVVEFTICLMYTVDLFAILSQVFEWPFRKIASFSRWRATSLWRSSPAQTGQRKMDTIMQIPPPIMMVESLWWASSSSFLTR